MGRSFIEAPANCLMDGEGSGLSSIALVALSPTGLCQQTHYTYLYVVTCFITTNIRDNIVSYTARGTRGPTRTNKYFF